MHILISIIVPVYNAEKYLKRCLDSLLAQTIRDKVEIILINDGSTDSSGDVLSSYESREINIKIFNVPNGGPSLARNIGIREATGVYIAFADADDEVMPEMYEFMLDSIQKHCAELSICRVNCIWQNKLSQINGIDFDGEVLEKGDIQKHIVDKLPLYIFNSLADKLYRKDIIKDNNIEFNTSIHYGEDTLFNLKYLCLCNKISYINKAMYNYHMNPQSLSKRFLPNKGDAHRYILDEIYKCASHFRLTEEFTKNYTIAILNSYPKQISFLWMRAKNGNSLKYKINKTKEIIRDMECTNILNDVKKYKIVPLGNFYFRFTLRTLQTKSIVIVVLWQLTYWYIIHPVKY